MAKSFLVVGASGQVRSGVARFLREAGHTVRTTTGKAPGPPDQVQVDVLTGQGLDLAFKGVHRAFFMSPGSLTRPSRSPAPGHSITPKRPASSPPPPLSVHPTKQWLAWGTVNSASINDEFDITKYPIFSGYPYFHANNTPTCKNANVSAAAPMNNSALNSGAKQLPPAVPGTINSLVTVAIGGPIYVFDPGLGVTDPANDNKPVKFPKHFDNTWILSGFLENNLYVAKLDTSDNGLKVSGQPSRQSGTLLPNPRNTVQSMYGTDEALYILNDDGDAYAAVGGNPGVMRVIYKGCGAPVSMGKPPARPEPYQRIWLSAGRLRVNENGPHTVSLHGLDGSLLLREWGANAAEYSLREWQVRLGLRPGVYLVRAETAAGVFTRSVTLN